MSTQEVRSSSKWSAIRSKAVPSNVISPVSDSSLTALNAEGALADQLALTSRLAKTGKLAKAKAIVRDKLNRPTAFTGSTGVPHPRPGRV